MRSSIAWHCCADRWMNLHQNKPLPVSPCYVDYILWVRTEYVQTLLTGLAAGNRFPLHEHTALEPSTRIDSPNFYDESLNTAIRTYLCMYLLHVYRYHKLWSQRWQTSHGETCLIMYLYFTFHLIGMYSQVSNKLAFRCSIAFFQITYLGRYIVPVGLLGTWE